MFINVSSSINNTLKQQNLSETLEFVVIEILSDNNGHASYKNTGERNKMTGQ